MRRTRTVKPRSKKGFLAAAVAAVLLVSALMAQSIAAADLKDEDGKLLKGSITVNLPEGDENVNSRLAEHSVYDVYKVAAAAPVEDFETFIFEDWADAASKTYYEENTRMPRTA